MCHFVIPPYSWSSPTIQHIWLQTSEFSILVVLFDYFSLSCLLGELLTKIGKMSSHFFGSFDLADSFFQLPLNPECKGLTTFTTEPGKLYNYLRLPQGLHNLPPALAKLTADVFGQLEFWYVTPMTWHKFHNGTHLGLEMNNWTFWGLF